MKKIICILLAVLMLCGCTSPAPTPPVTEPMIHYEWMSGDSPISAQRSGRFMQGIEQTQKGFECTASGVYFMRNDYLYYCDHGSDQLIKLCGRPDCPHTNYSCNARFSSAGNICYYDGYLYTVQNTRLIRINTDGTERVTILDVSNANENAVPGNYFSPQIWNGIFTIGFAMLDDDGREYYEYYYYKLDGSMDSMEPVNDMGLPYQNDGDAFITQGASALSEDGTSFHLWDSESGTQTYLTEYVGLGYYGAEEAYYMRDGVIYRLTYATGEESAMVDTGLDGSHFVHCFADCIVVSLTVPVGDRWSRETLEQQVLYIYNWDFDLVEKVELTYEGAEKLYNPICGETPERIILLDPVTDLPRYYIAKSEIGSNQLSIHELQLPTEVVDSSEMVDFGKIPLP